MINANCLIMTPDRVKLYEQFPKLKGGLVKIFRDDLSEWYKATGKSNSVTPSKEEFIRFMAKRHINLTDYVSEDEIANLKITNIWHSSSKNTMLSNFAERPFFFKSSINGDTYTVNSVEQAFQLEKLLSSSVWDDESRWNEMDSYRDQLLSTKDATKIKSLGRRVPMTKEDLKAWDEKKRDIMKSLIRQSLIQNPRTLQALLATGNSTLTHLQAKSIWKTQFPIILEELRDEFRGSDEYINLDNFMTVKSDKVIVMQAKKPWRSDPTKVNDTMRIYLKSKPEIGYFEVVKDEEDNYYSVHFKPEDKNNPNAWSKEEKEILFQAVADIIPAGAYLSTHGELTKGGIAGLNRFENLGFTEVERREVKTKEGEKTSITIPVWQKEGTTVSEDSGYIINEHEGRWTRDEVANDPHTLYIFTDNTDRTSGGNEIGEGWYAEKYGKGGYGTEHNPTSAVIRGLPNAAPISTMKWFYKNHGVSVPEARWLDVDIEEFKAVIDEEIEDIKRLWDTGNYTSIEIPMNGIFGRDAKGKDKGIAQLTKTRTPRLYQYLNKKMEELAEYVKDSKRSREFKDEASVIDASNWHKFDADVSSIRKRARINLINDIFTQEVNRVMDETSDRLNAELSKATTRGEKLRLAKAIKNLRPYIVIKQKGPFELFERVKKHFEDYMYLAENNKQALIDEELDKIENSKNANMPASMKRKIAENKVNHKIAAHKQMLENWNDLVIDAANTYGYEHGVIMDVANSKIEEDIDDTPTDDEGNNRNEDNDDKKDETPYKEGWQVDVRELSAFESMTNQVRRVISSIYRVDRNGEYIPDDLGYKQKLQASYVFADLINSLKDMTSASQMMPMLRALRGRKSWAGQIIDALENDDRLFTSFYRVLRKDYLNMWVQIESTNPDGSVVVKTHNINKPIGTSHYFDEWRDNFEYGIVLDDDSIYNHDGEIVLDKAKVGLGLVDGTLDKFRNAKTKEEQQQVILDNVKPIHKMLSMIGVSITEDTLRDVLTYNVNPNDTADLPGSIVLNSLRVIFKDMPSNTGIKNGEPADLINIYGRAFNAIAMAINNVEEDEVESSTRQGKKTLFAHTRPSYMTTLIKKLRGEGFREFIENEYKPVDFLYDKNQGKWLNSLIDDLENDDDARDKLNHAVVIEYNRKEYEKWTPLDTFLVLFNQYNAEPISGGEGYAWYQSPLLSDATSAEFIRAKRIKKNFREVLSDKFTNLVRQEYNRIITVKERYNSKENIEKIAYYDMSDDKKGGAKFHFFPEFNTSDYNVVDINGEAHVKASLTEEQLAEATNERSFFDYLAEVSEDTDEFNRVSKEAVKSAMDSNFARALDKWSSIGVFDRVDENNDASPFKYFSTRTSRKNIESALEEYYWNSTYMQSQIIQLLTTDLAYYGNYTNFTKRALEFHSPTEKLNTLAKWDGKYVLADEDGNVRPERVIYLKDEIKISNVTSEVEKVIDEKIARGELTAADKSVILDKWRKTNVTDAQAYRTLKSFRATMIAADMWDDDMETAYNNINNNTWTARDFTVLWNTRKPYLYTQTNQPDRVGGTMRMSTQHKNSEMIMLTQAIFGSILHNSTKFRALSEYMENNDIDVAMFGTAVKVGGQGLIDINGIEDASKVEQVLNSKIKNADGSYNNEVVHEFNWEDYGLQVATPEHGINAIQLVGTQIRRLIGTDMSSDAKFKIGNKELTREQWRNFFNAVNIANIREAFEKLDKEFSDTKKISKLLIKEIKSSKRYSNDLIEAVSLDENGQFNIPLFDPAQSQKIQELLNSIIKSRIVKQKIAGGSLIQASDWALNEKDKPRIVFETDKNGKEDRTRIKYIEAYIACPDDRLYELLLEDDGSININKKDSKGNYIVPEKYRQAIGYRIPTEDKYSMLPIRVKGFLPRQVGSVIILPDEITTTTGSDFDVDKIYMMYHTLDYRSIYDIKRAWDDFYKNPDNADIVDEIKSNFGEALEQYINEQTEDWDEAPDSEDRKDLEEEFKGWLRKEGVRNYNFSVSAQNRFTEWFSNVKHNYLMQKAIRTVEYKEDKDVDYNNKMALYNLAKKNNKAQRDSMIIDLMWSVLTNSDTAGKMINPGNFDEQKRDARIINLLDNLSLGQINRMGGVKHILSLTLDEADDMLEEFGGIVNPLTPDTWIDYQQRNMSGANLVPMAATQNASHALTQLTKNFGLKAPYRFLFNGKRLGSLHSIKSADDKFISRNVCSYLAAFVDNAKDPVAGDLNINSTTANLAFLLLRIGNSPITTGLILRQPAMMRVMKYVNSGRYSVAQAIEECFDYYKKNKADVPYDGKTIDFNFTDEWLAENIAAEKNAKFGSSNLAEHEFANNQMKVLVMLGQLSKAADALGDVVRAVRSDSQSGGPGGSIAAGNEKIDGVVNILNGAAAKKSYPLEGLNFLSEMFLADSEEAIINSTIPIQTATFQYGLMMTQKWYRQLFPQVSSIFRDVIDIAKINTTYGHLDDTTVNRIYSNFIVYLMTGFSNDFKGTAEERDYYINQFPREFNDIKSSNPYLVETVPVLRRLKVLFNNKYNGSPVIVFNNVGKVTEIQSEDYRSDFRNLLQNENTRELTKKLLIYSFYRGLGFSPSGYSNLIPSMVKMSDVTDYVKALRSIVDYVSANSYMQSTSDDMDIPVRPGSVENFLVQYIRNNLSDRRFVPEVSGTGIFKDTPPDNFSVTVDDHSSQEMKKFTFMKKSPDDPIMYRPFICYTYKGAKYYYTLEDGGSQGNYKRVKPLGSRHYQEYDFNEIGDIMESKIAEPKRKSFDSYREQRAASQMEAAIAGNEDYMEQAYASMPNYDDVPLSPEELLHSSREGMRIRIGQQLGINVSDRRPIAEPNVTPEQERQMEELESLYQRFRNLNPQDTDMENNKKCK